MNYSIKRIGIPHIISQCLLQVSQNQMLDCQILPQIIQIKQVKQILPRTIQILHQVQQIQLKDGPTQLRDRPIQQQIRLLDIQIRLKD